MRDILHFSSSKKIFRGDLFLYSVIPFKISKELLLTYDVYWRECYKKVDFPVQQVEKGLHKLEI